MAEKRPVMRGPRAPSFASETRARPFSELFKMVRPVCGPPLVGVLVKSIGPLQDLGPVEIRQIAPPVPDENPSGIPFGRIESRSGTSSRGDGRRMDGLPEYTYARCTSFWRIGPSATGQADAQRNQLNRSADQEQEP